MAQGLKLNSGSNISGFSSPVQPDRGFTRDHDKFINLWEKGSNLITSIPGYSTHMETEYLSPAIDWEKLLQEEIDKLGESK